MGLVIDHPNNRRRSVRHPIPDPRRCAAALFDELARRTGLTDEEMAEEVRQATNDPMVDARIFRRWRRGDDHPPFDYACVLLCLVGTEGLAALAETLQSIA